MRSRRLWVTSDTHFNHDYLGFDNIEATNRFMRKWNRKVGPMDTVIHLGDVIFRRPSELNEILSRLNGKKILAKGNHDKHRNSWYRNKGFSIVVDKLEIDDYVFTHIPEPWWKLALSGKKNIHGHLHYPQREDRKGGRTNRHILVPERDIVLLSDLK